MAVEKIDTLVVGAGQAGVAMSEHLSNLAVPHVVLERARIAERWRTERWDSLVANGPAWHDRFPGLEFDDIDPDAFAPKERVADYFEAYAKKINAPIRTGVEVKKVERNAGRAGFTIETSECAIEANHVVAATGAFQRPIIPPIAPRDEKIAQLHSADYYNPQQLPEGAVLVVGAGSSGVQIAEELQSTGKKVYLSVGPHDRPPRTYRNRDYCWWLGILGEWNRESMMPGTEHITIAVSGANCGHTVDFRALANKGISLVGLTKSFNNGIVTFESDLVDNIARGDNNYLELLDAADAYIARNGLDLPEEPEARNILPDPECVTNPILELDLAEVGVTSIIWATGYTSDYSWVNVDNAFDENGKPQHRRGVSTEPGIYFLGLPWLSSRGSSFIWGVWHDAKHIADHIATQRKYITYRAPSECPTETADWSKGARRSHIPYIHALIHQNIERNLMPTHTRIRMFNTKETYPNQTLDNDLCQAVRAGNTVYVRGQVGTDFDGNLLGLGDPAAQAEQAMKNVKQLLEEAGSDMSHIVKTTTYITDPRFREAVYRETGKWMKGVFPVSTGIVVQALAQPEWLMEIDVIAVIPDAE